MEEVPVVARKKVFVTGDSAESQLVSEMVEENLSTTIVKNLGEAEIVVIVWRGGQPQIGSWEEVFGKVVAQLPAYQTNEPPYFIFVGKDDPFFQGGAAELNLSEDPRFKYVGKITLPIGRKGWVEEFHSELNKWVRALNVIAGVPSSPAVSPDDLLIANFPLYAHADDASSSHSRQERDKYFQEKLRFEKSDTPEVRMKKIILLFAHYMSIGDMSSSLSKTIEDFLAYVSMYPDTYRRYQASCTRNRARDKNDDRIAIELRRLLLKRYGGVNNDFLEELIKKLSPIDSIKLERSFWYEEKADEINTLIQAAEAFYDQEMQEVREADRKRAARKRKAEQQEVVLEEGDDFDGRLELLGDPGLSFYRPVNSMIPDVRSCKGRLDILDDSYTPDDKDVERYTAKQLMLIFAHYMSVDATSPISKFIEHKLVLALFSNVEYFDYQRKMGDRVMFFAFRQRSTKEAISGELRNKIEAKFKREGGRGIIGVWNQLELFINLLRCATRIENRIRDDMLAHLKFGPHDERNILIQHTAMLADRVFDQLMQNPELGDIQELTQGLQLPNDVEAILSPSSAHPIP